MLTRFFQVLIIIIHVFFFWNLTDYITYSFGYIIDKTINWLISLIVVCIFQYILLSQWSPYALFKSSKKTIDGAK